MSEPRPVGLQLYSVREAMDRDATATLERVAALGFMGVEIAGTYGLEPAQLRHHLGDFGLQLISSMVGLTEHGLAPATIEAALEIGTPRLVVNAWPNQFATLDAVQRLAESMHRAAEQARSVNIDLGYHNHFWEFLQTDAGACPMSLFTSMLTGCFLELDLYWLRSAFSSNGEALTVLHDLAPQVRLVHVKDGPGELPTAQRQAAPMTPAGTGIVDITEMLAALPNAEWHVVEFDDCSGDMFDNIDASLQYLVRGGLSVARPQPSMAPS